jgi:hypothetical protein
MRCTARHGATGGAAQPAGAAPRLDVYYTLYSMLEIDV